MANTLDTFTAATVIGDTDLLHLKVGTGANSDKKITGANAKTAFLPTAYIGQNLQSGASYTLALTDAGKVVELTHGSACGVVIPANATVPFPVNTRIDIVQGGAGLLTVTITSDTLRGNVISFGQYKALSLWKRAATEWVVFGGTT